MDSIDDSKRPLICADDNIPYLKGRLEPFARMRYVDQDDFAPEIVRDADAMIIRTRTRCDYPLLRGSRVKFIATATIGMDQFNIPACRDMGITVCNAPGCNAPAVSQYVWASLLHLGVDPAHATIGIIGHGNVGSIVQQWADLLGARTLIYDPFKEEELRKDPVANAAILSRYTSLDTLLADSDAVTLHTPLTRSGDHPTFHLISRREFDIMRPGTIFVNAARGPVADNDAIKYAIRERGVRAVIDCWEGEPNLDLELLEMVEIGTFHIAGYSFEGKQRATRMAVEAVADHFGFHPDLSDLEGPYIPKTHLDPRKIMADFNPFALTQRLRREPHLFDANRAAYELRAES